MILVDLPDSAATEAMGARLAAQLRVGDVVALTGDLGAGKTTLVRGMVRALQGEACEVPSPTFTLLQHYPAADAGESRETGPEPNAGRHLDVFHFDLYRLKHPDDVFELGWEEIAGGAALVEWPDRAGEHLPVARLDVALGFQGAGRVARLTIPAGDPGQWRDRLHGI